MLRFKAHIFLFILFVASSVSLRAQSADEVELNAQSILARVDRIMDYPAGEIEGVLKHIQPDGVARSISFSGKISRENFLFVFKNRSRGDQLKVLYNYGGEDIWVYNIHSIQLFHKMGIDKYDPILATNYSFLDFSNSNFQSNYNAKITGTARIKGIECHKLKLIPIFKGGEYGELTLYASRKNYLPMRIDFSDRNKVIFKFMSLAKTMERGGRIIPVRYDMLNIKTGTITILSFFKFNENIKFQPEIFRHEKLGE